MWWACCIKEIRKESFAHSGPTIIAIGKQILQRHAIEWSHFVREWRERKEIESWTPHSHQDNAT